MFNIALNELSNKKKQLVTFFSIFLIIYIVIDNLTMTYSNMITTYGTYLVVINLLLNIVMAIITSVTQTLSLINLKLKGNDTKSSNVTFIGFIFSIMTYGCTSCVISFLSIFGITYSISALALNGLPYKLLTLLILIGGLIFTRFEINRPCKVKTV